jgi:hypothetical protein
VVNDGDGDGFALASISFFASGNDSEAIIAGSVTPPASVLLPNSASNAVTVPSPRRLLDVRDEGGVPGRVEIAERAEARDGCGVPTRGRVDASNERPLFRREGGQGFEQAVRIEEIADIAEANRHEAGTNAGRAHIEHGE